MEKSLRKAASAWSPCDSGTMRRLSFKWEGEAIHSWVPGRGRGRGGGERTLLRLLPTAVFGATDPDTGSINAHAEASFCSLILRS